MKRVLRHVNDVMHSSGLTGFPVRNCCNSTKSNFEYIHYSWLTWVINIKLGNVYKVWKYFDIHGRRKFRIDIDSNLFYFFLEKLGWARQIATPRFLHSLGR